MLRGSGRAGGNPNTSRHYEKKDDGIPLLKPRDWRDENPFLNGEHSRREKHKDAAKRHAAEAAANAPPVHDPDMPVVTGRSFGMVAEDEKWRLKFLSWLWGGVNFD